MLTPEQTARKAELDAKISANVALVPDEQRELDKINSVEVPGEAPSEDKGRVAGPSESTPDPEATPESTPEPPPKAEGEDSTDSSEPSSDDTGTEKTPDEG